jgi:hypothetical protein
VSRLAAGCRFVPLPNLERDAGGCRLKIWPAGACEDMLARLSARYPRRSAFKAEALSNSAVSG